MAKSRRSAPGLVVLLVGALVGCDAPDRGKDRGEDQTTTAKSALTTSLFQAAVTYATGSRAKAVAIGDLDNDGRSDVAVVTTTGPDAANDKMVHVFIQDSDGSLKPRVRYPLGAEATSIDIGDVNGDGRADVVLAVNDRPGRHVGVLLQNGSGTLDPQVSYPTVSAHQVKAGDFNGDGRIDVAALSWSTDDGGLQVFLQTEAGTLAAPVTYTVPHAGYNELDAGDIDGDGRTDLVVMSGQSYDVPDVSILLQTPDGTFGAPTSYSLNGNVTAGGVAVGDVNGDGRTDVVLTDSSGPFIARFLQNAQGTLDAPASCPSLGSASAVVLADVDGDARKDAVLAHRGSIGIGVFRQFPSGDFVTEERITAPEPSPDQPQALAVGDINGDGRPDVVIAGELAGMFVLRHVSDVSLGIAIASPAGGPYYVNEPLTVRWVLGDVVAVTGVDVSVTVNNGLSYTPLCTGLPATATECPWTPTATGSGFRMRVTAHDSAGQTASSEASFNVVTPSITVSGVAASQFIGAAMTLSWFHNLPAGDTVRIELSRDGGGTYETLAASVPISSSGGTSGSFAWTVTGPATTTARLRVSANGAWPASGSTANFAIAAVTPSITTPGVGATQYIGMGTTLTWFHNLPTSETVRIELSRDGGGTYETLAASVPISNGGGTSGSFPWTVTGPATTNARLRVTANGPSAASATTGKFAIAAVPTTPVLVRLTDGVAYTSYLSVDFMPFFAGSPTVRVDLSRDGGATFQTIATDAPTVEGHFSGSVPGPGAADARIRITANGFPQATGTSDGFRLVESTLAVTAPATNSVVLTGATLAITWSTNMPASWSTTIELSRNGGSTYQALSFNAPNTGSFAWTVTGPATSAARVRVKVSGAAIVSATSGSFSIEQPSLTVTGPAAGAAFLAGTPVAITWSTNLPATSPVTVELSRDGGGSYEVLAAGAPNTGSFTWVATGPATSAARIRVTITGPGGISATSGTFSIAQPSLTVTGPGAGASFYAGTPAAITWTTNLPAASPVTVELSRDGGGSYEVLGAGAPNTGSFAALVTGPSTNAARVRVTIGGAPSLSATSGTFAIAEPSLTVTGPAPGAGLYTGAPAAITWASNLPATSPVVVELSRDGGLTFETLAAAAPNTGSFAWLVTGPEALGALARVTIADPVAVSGVSGTFAIVAPSLTVTGPAAGAPVYAGAPVTISWTHNVSPGDPVSIELSRDGGATFEVLAAAVANTGSFVWTATGPDSAEARVRVTANGAVTASGLGPAFSIVTASLAVTSPVAGEGWAIGTARTIAWSASNLPVGTTVRVELSRDGGASWTTLAAAAPASGSQAWTATAPATTAAIVRVTANGSVPAVATSAAFAIGNPALSVTAPVAGATWTIGTTQAITWNSNLLPSATVKVQISRNGGGTYTALATSAPNTGSFLWTATGAATTTAIVKVTAVGFSATGLSGVFSLVSPTVTVTSPNTAVTWTIGTTQAITWTHNVGADATFQIEVSRGGVWSTIVDAAPGGGATTGSYAWTVTGPKASNCKVRVTWVGPNTAKDTSDVAFKIN